MSHIPGTKSFPFSPTAIDALPATAGRRVEYRDTRCPGLILRVTAMGAKSYCAVAWNPKVKRPERVTLGPWPKMRLEMARERAKAIVSDITAGVSHVEAKAKLADELTLAELFKLFLRERRDHKGRALTANTVSTYKTLFAKHAAPVIGSRKLSTLTPETIAAVLTMAPRPCRRIREAR
jgi:hypothetical protein